MKSLPRMGGVRSRVRLAEEIIGAMREHARAGDLPLWRQALEMLWLKVRRQQTCRFYLMARMWRRSMPWSDKVDHLNFHEFSRLIDSLNPPRARQSYRSKREQKQRLLASGIGTPMWLGYFHTQAGQDADGGALVTSSQLATLLRAHADQRLVFKRVVGSGGEGFMSYQVRITTDGMVLLEHPLTQQRIGVDELVQQMSACDHGYLIERYLHQHAMLARLNPESVNTLRVWATNEGSTLRVVGLFLRIGRRTVMVDNTAAGGLICTVDEQSGQLQQLTTGDLYRRAYSAHPDSGVAIAGMVMPYLAEAKQLACAALASFPGMGIAGLDIAIAEHGPEVIEVNLDNPAQIGMACFDKPGRRLFPTFFHERRPAESQGGSAQSDRDSRVERNQ